MKRHCVVWGTALCVGLALPVVAAEPSHEHAAGAGSVQLELDHGRKWPTDEALRQGMTNMRAALAADLKAIHANKASDAQYEALAAKLNAEVAYVVANCKLEPRADAELHKLIAEILAGAEAMQRKEPGAARRAGAVRVVRALDGYGEFFDHPGWKGL